MTDDRLLQEIYRDDPWKLLVCCILLNQTTRKQVDAVREVLFERWHDAKDMAECDQEELARVIESTGFQRRKAHRLRTMSIEYLYAQRVFGDLDVIAVAAMTGVGEYAEDSWAIFVDGDNPPVDSVSDKELKKYLERNASEPDEVERSLHPGEQEKHGG